MTFHFIGALVNYLLRATVTNMKVVLGADARRPSFECCPPCYVGNRLHRELSFFLNGINLYIGCGSRSSNDWLFFKDLSVPSQEVFGSMWSVRYNGDMRWNINGLSEGDGILVNTLR